MRGKVEALAGLLWFVAGGALWAQDASRPVTSFTADVGFVNTAGNTSVSTLNVGERFLQKSAGDRLVFTQLLGIVYGESDGETNAENYRAQLRLDYKVDGFYVFTLAGWERNVFGGVARRFEETIGVALKPLQLPQHELSVEVGVSMFQQRATVAQAGDLSDNFAAGRAAALYRHRFATAAFVSQSVEFMPNFELGTDWRLNTETALVAPLSTRIGLKISYVVRYDHLPGLAPPPNPTGARLERTDRFFTTGLTISY